MGYNTDQKATCQVLNPGSEPEDATYKQWQGSSGPGAGYKYYPLKFDVPDFECTACSAGKFADVPTSTCKSTLFFPHIRSPVFFCSRFLFFLLFQA
jgi:hypothetical protein